MQIKTSLRHFPESSAMTEADINAYLEKKFKFMNRCVAKNDVVDFKIKKKGTNRPKDADMTKSVYEISTKGKLKTGEEFFYTKESVDMKAGIDLLAQTVKADTAEKIKAKQEKPKGFRCLQKEVETTL